MNTGKVMTSLEKHHIKITIAVAIVVIIFIISTTYSVTRWQANTDAELNRIGQNQVRVMTDVKALQEKSVNGEIQFATINTKLANIEALLLDIRMDLKSHESVK